MGRVLALDIGKKRTGVAVSDPLQIVAVGLDTIVETELTPLVEKVVTLAVHYEVEKIIVGVPYHADGTKGEQVLYVEEFIAKLQGQVAVPLILEDERYTSELAEQNLRKSKKGKRYKQDKTMIDQQSAILILQQFLGR